jgi:hypothetical protein
MNKFIKGRSLVFRNALPPEKSLATATQRFVIAKWLVLTVLILFVLASPVQALTFNVTYDSSVTSLANAAQVEAAFAIAAQTIQNLYSNPITVNISVYWGNTGPFTGGIDLGASYTQFLGYYTYAQLTNALRAARTTVADNSAVASLPPSDPIAGNQWWCPRAEVKALGLPFASPNDTRGCVKSRSWIEHLRLRPVSDKHEASHRTGSEPNLDVPRTAGGLCRRRKPGALPGRLRRHARSARAGLRQGPLRGDGPTAV